APQLPHVPLAEPRYALQVKRAQSKRRFAFGVHRRGGPSEEGQKPRKHRNCNSPDPPRRLTHARAPPDLALRRMVLRYEIYRKTQVHGRRHLSHDRGKFVSRWIRRHKIRCPSGQTNKKPPGPERFRCPGGFRLAFRLRQPAQYATTPPARRGSAPPRSSPVSGSMRMAWAPPKYRS